MPVLDAVHALIDHRAVHPGGTSSVRVAELSQELGRPLSLIAESDLNDPRLITPWHGGGLGLDAQWNDDVHHAIHTAVSGERQGYYADFGSFECLAKVLCGGFFHDGTYSSFRRRHHGRPSRSIRCPHRGSLCTPAITTRSATAPSATDRPPTSIPGNSPSKRHSCCCPRSPRCCSRARNGRRETPFQYFTSHPEPELGDAVRNGRRAEFAEHGCKYTEDVPDPQDPETFRRSVLDWSEPSRPENAAMLDFYRSLTRACGTTNPISPTIGLNP